MPVSKVSEIRAAVAFTGLATAAHQAWSASIYILSSGVFHRNAIDSVAGPGGMAAAVGCYRHGG